MTNRTALMRCMNHTRVMSGERFDFEAHSTDARPAGASVMLSIGTDSKAAWGFEPGKVYRLVILEDDGLPLSAEPEGVDGK